MTRFFKNMVTLFLLVFANINCYASDTPNDLAKNLIQSFENYDVVLYESLIYPDTLKKLKANNIETYLKNLRLKFKEMRKISEYDSYEIIIMDITSGEGYKPNSQMVKLINNKWGLFPVIPIKRLKITAVDKGEVSTYTEQALTKYLGKWYIVWPTEVYDMKLEN